MSADETPILHLTVLSPEGELLRADVDRVTLAGATGEIELLPGHEPLVCGVQPGTLRYWPAGEGREQTLELAAGLLEVGESGATLFADGAASPPPGEAPAGPAEG